jgi:hypothetical protein
MITTNIRIVRTTRNQTKAIQERTMEAIEFACVFEEIAKSLKIELDSDIAGNIFDIYEGYYENYTLLELIGLLRDEEHDITCPWNKKALIKMIKDNNINIPKKYEPMKPTEWEHYRIRRSLDVIDAKYLEFYEGSIIQEPTGQVYMLETMCEEIQPDDGRTAVVMYFINMDTDEELIMYAEDFIWSIDNEDVTILQNRDCMKFMNEEQEEYWTNNRRGM